MLVEVGLYAMWETTFPRLTHAGLGKSRKCCFPRATRRISAMKRGSSCAQSTVLYVQRPLAYKIARSIGLQRSNRT